MRGPSSVPAPGGRTGFALAYAVIVVFIVTVILLSLTQFRSFVTHGTELAVQELNALGAAEAGVVAALSELQASAAFATHEKATLTNESEVAGNPFATPVFRFETPRNLSVRSSRLALKKGMLPGLEPLAVGPGVYSFSLGKGLGSVIGRGFASTFSVRVAPLMLENYAKPLIAIEARGRFDQRVVGIHCLAEANPLADFLVADGEYADIGMGSPNDQENQNVFSLGWFYGQQFIQVANIKPSGTKQAFKQFGGFRSGGFLWFADRYEPTFLGSGADGPAGSWAPLGRDPARPAPGDPRRPDYFDSTKGHARDDRHQGGLRLPSLTADMTNIFNDPDFKNKIDLSRLPAAGTPDDSDAFEDKPYVRIHDTFPNPYKDRGDPAVEIFFGKPGYLKGIPAGEGDDPLTYENDLPAASSERDGGGAPGKPANLLYCTGKDVVVWGCPDRDVAIYTDRDIYVVGDFNQSPWHHQIYTSQDPDAPDAPARDGLDSRYIDPVRFAIDPSASGSDLESLEKSREGWGPGARRIDAGGGSELFQERKLARLIAGGRIWFDYRYSTRFVANELIPWFELQLLWHMLGSATSAQPDDAQLATALEALAYEDQASFSDRDKARARFDTVTAPLTPLLSGPGQPTSMGRHLIEKVLCFPEGSPGFAAALAALGTTPGPIKAARIPELAEKLFFGVMCPQERKDLVNGIWKSVQAYHDTVFNGSGSDVLNRHKSPFGSRTLSTRLRLYVPEMTINAVLTDGARRNATWSVDPSSDAKIYNELGNATVNKKGCSYRRYLLSGDRSRRASPGVGRLYGSLHSLRQNSVEPKLTGGVYKPLKRKRIFPRGQARWMGLAFAFGNGGDAGLKEVVRVLARREVVLAAERGVAEEVFTNWR